MSKSSFKDGVLPNGEVIPDGDFGRKDWASDAGGGRAMSRDSLQALDHDRLVDILMKAVLRHPDLMDDLQDSGVNAPVADRAPVGDDLAQYMVGDSPAMMKVYETIRRFALVDAPVLVTGESGTGKELAARAMHERSSFKDGPFVAVNCGGLTETLVASELYGHEKGAFTGASERRVGRIEHADGGTLFLDEVGEMPRSLQPQLLRFLQDMTVTRLGGEREIKVHTRVVAATNANLETGVSKGRFRDDLYFRLNVLRLHMPPLRERDDDIALLANYVVSQLARDLRIKYFEIEPATYTALRAYDWPGNVRELISRLRRALVMADDGVIRSDDLGLEDTGSLLKRGEFWDDDHDGLAAAHRRPGSYEADEVRVALERHQFNVTRAAKELRVSRVTLYKLMRRFEISRN